MPTCWPIFNIFKYIQERQLPLMTYIAHLCAIRRVTSGESVNILIGTIMVKTLEHKLLHVLHKRQRQQLSHRTSTIFLATCYSVDFGIIHFQNNNFKTTTFNILLSSLNLFGLRLYLFYHQPIISQPWPGGGWPPSHPYPPLLWKREK